RDRRRRAGGHRRPASPRRRRAAAPRGDRPTLGGLMTELVKAHRRVLKTSVGLVDQVQVADLGRPTPCAGWDLRQLLAHMIGQNYGFAAAADGDGADLAVFADRPVGDDPAAEYSASADRVIAAFRRPRLAGEYVAVAALRGGVTLPGQVMMGAHLVDYVVH